MWYLLSLSGLTEGGGSLSSKTKLEKGKASLTHVLMRFLAHGMSCLPHCQPHLPSSFCLPESQIPPAWSFKILRGT